MEFFRQISRFFQNVPRFFEKRDFKNRVRQEKTKKYLVARPAPVQDRVIASLSDPRKRFRFVSTIYAKIESEKNRLTVFFGSLGVIMLFLSSYIAFGSPYFQVNPGKVIIERLDSGSDVNIAYKSIEKISGKSLFSVSRSEVAKLIIDNQKNIRSAEVSKLYPNGLKIILSSYPPEFFTYFTSPDRYYGITGNGVLIYQRSKPANLPLLDIVDKSLSESEFLEYREGVPEKKMEKILRVRNVLSKVFPGANPSKFTFFRTEQELHVSFESGVRILLSLDGTEDAEIEKLHFWNSQESGALAKGGIAYVDLRVPVKVFVCRQEGVCKKNLIQTYGPYYRN